MDLYFNIFFKFLSWCKGKFFWKNSNIIYINSNKKIFSKNDIDAKTETRNAVWLTCESNTKLGYKFYKHHLLKMKKRLYDITRNCEEKCDITYAGFVSPMFAVFDGYCLGDNRNYTFIDINSDNSKPYKVEYKKQIKSINPVEIVNSTINILICSTFDIDESLVGDGQNIVFREKSGSKVSLNYLVDVYNFTKSVLDKATNNNVQLINLYIAAKQP